MVVCARIVIVAVEDVVPVVLVWVVVVPCAVWLLDVVVLLARVTVAEDVVSLVMLVLRVVDMVSLTLVVPVVELVPVLLTVLLMLLLLVTLLDTVKVLVLVNDADVVVVAVEVVGSAPSWMAGKLSAISSAASARLTKSVIVENRTCETVVSNPQLLRCPACAHIYGRQIVPHRPRCISTFDRISIAQATSLVITPAFKGIIVQDDTSMSCSNGKMLRSATNTQIHWRQEITHLVCCSSYVSCCFCAGNGVYCTAPSFYREVVQPGTGDVVTTADFERGPSTTQVYSRKGVPHVAGTTSSVRGERAASCHFLWHLTGSEIHDRQVVSHASSCATSSSQITRPGRVSMVRSAPALQGVVIQNRTGVPFGRSNSLCSSASSQVYWRKDIPGASRADVTSAGLLATKSMTVFAKGLQGAIIQDDIGRDDHRLRQSGGAAPRS
ncbi:unnamed protein product [Symbiodinium sp. CCMP2592]|nr:unnamed protein product [Symbiodinium sp. CCMP2592]